MSWTIEALKASHEREHFQCGHVELDDYIRKYARQHDRKGIGRTFVAVASGTRQVLGYYTLSSSSVAFENLPEILRAKLPRYPLPVALLAKLAVDQGCKGQGLGEFLLLDALNRVLEISQQLALYAVEVHALDAAAKGFYEKYGFESFLDHPLHLFLPLATIRQLP